jgi:hypothetical protein
VGDRAGILGYKDTWRSCKSAFRLVTKNRPRILRLAKHIAGNVEKPVPMPATFPATLADFLQLIITGTEPEARLHAYVHAQTEKFFADSQLLFATPEERLTGMESWTTAQLGKFQNGFSGPDTWTGTARAFKAWTAKNQPIKSHGE